MVGSAAVKVLEYSCCNKHTDINPHVVGRGGGGEHPRPYKFGYVFLARNMLKRATCHELNQLMNDTRLNGNMELMNIYLKINQFQLDGLFGR